eukprot:gene15271-15422_t
MVVRVNKVHSDLFPDFEFFYEAQSRTAWLTVRPDGPVRATESFVRQLAAAQSYVANRASNSADFIIHFCVTSSDVSGIYNFGGDLPFFVQCVREQDRAALQFYAHACVDMIYNNSVGWGTDALSILDAVRAERMILSGKIYTAAELFDLGLVDVLAEDGKGKDEVRRLIGDTRRFEVLRSLKKVRQRILPLDVQEMHDITDIWVDNVMKTHASDLRRMERLVTAQMRRVSAIGQTEPAPV